MLFACSSWLCLLRAEAAGRRSDAIAFAASASLGFLAHLTFVYCYAGFLVWTACKYRSPRFRLLLAAHVLPIATGLGLSPFATGLAALALNVTAYNAETFRAGIGSIRRGQLEAAMALGMSRAQAVRRIVLPQAVRRILPVLASTWVSLFKDTSLVSVIAVSELAFRPEKSSVARL